MRLDLDPWAIFGCIIAKWTILYIVVHFQPVIKLLQKGVRVHQKRVILMQKMQNFSGEGAQPPPPVGTPPPHPLGASILTPPHSEILPTLLCILTVTIVESRRNEGVHQTTQTVLVDIIAYTAKTVMFYRHCSQSTFYGVWQPTFSCHKFLHAFVVKQRFRCIMTGLERFHASSLELSA